MSHQIIIIGTNPIAFSIAQTLCEEPDMSVYIIESDEKRYNEVKDTLDAVLVLGYEVDPEILKQANVENSDILIALHSDDSINITATLIAKYFNPEIKVIGVIDITSYENYSSILSKKNSPIDYLMSPELIVADTALELVQHPDMTEYISLSTNKVVLVGIKSSKKFIDKNIFEIKKMISPLSTLIVSINRDNSFIIPRGGDRVKEGDILYCIILKNDLSLLFEKFEIQNKEVKNILIGGGGRYTKSFLKKIENLDYNTTIIEYSKKAIDDIKERYPNIRFIEADIKNIDKLEHQKLFETDFYMAMTDDEHVNFVSSLYAKNVSNVNTLVLSFRNETFERLMRYGVNFIVNPKKLIINKVLEFLHRGQVLSEVTLWNEQAEMIEVIPSSNCQFLNTPLKDIKKIPEGVLVGVVEHHGVAQIATGDTVIKEKDKVVFFAKTKVVEKLLKILR